MSSWFQNLKDKYGAMALDALKKALISLLNHYIPDSATSKFIAKDVQMKDAQVKTYDCTATVVDTKGLLMRMCRGVVAKGVLNVSATSQVFQTMVGDISVDMTPTSIADDDGDPFMPSVTGKFIGAKAGPIGSTISGSSVPLKGSNDSSQWDGSLLIAPNWGAVSGQVKITGSVANLTIELKAVLK
jgi:hypothetical protein